MRAILVIHLCLLSEEEILCAVRPTVLMPSTNFVRKSTFALLNMPSLSETTMN